MGMSTMMLATASVDDDISHLTKRKSAMAGLIPTDGLLATSSSSQQLVDALVQVAAERGHVDDDVGNGLGR